MNTLVLERTVVEWMAHPDALDRLLRFMTRVSTKYEMRTPKQRFSLCDKHWPTYVINERASGRLPIPVPRCAS